MKYSALRVIRQSKTARFFAAFIAINLITQLCFPTVSWALTSGPAQEEFSSFEPASTSDMVDIYSGDFTYNIPLLTVPGPNGGYPINLSYHSGATMDQEASWVGLGWSLNVGSINRQIRGLPDDYNQANDVVHTQHYKESFTASLDLSQNVKVKIFGLNAVNLGVGASVYYNNFKGLGYRVYSNIGYPTSDKLLDAGGSAFKLGLSFDSQNGIGIEPDFSVTGNNTNSTASIGLCASLNTRQGLQSIGFTTSYGDRQKSTKDPSKYEEKNGHSSTLNFSFGQVAPRVQMPMVNHVYSFDITPNMASAWPIAFDVPAFSTTFGGSLTLSSVASNGSNPNSVVSETGVGYIYTPGTTNGTVQKDFSREQIPYSDKVPNLAPSSFTYDIYTQTGQGTGGMFRPYLSANGILTDPTITSHNDNIHLGVEIGADGISDHVEVEGNYSYGTNTSGPWQIGSAGDDVAGLNTLMNYNAPTSSSDATYENYYFQMYGEKSAVMLADDYLGRNWGGDQAYRADIAASLNPSFLDSHFATDGNFEQNATTVTGPTTISNQKVNYNGGRISPMAYKLLGKRQIRGTNIEPFTTVQDSMFGYTGYQTSYTVDNHDVGGTATDKINYRTSSIKGAIGEISVLQDDGMRYVYGLPQYNNSQLDATFSVNGPTNNDITKTPVVVNSTTGVIDPSGTYEEYLSQTELKKPYANSWLLTQVLSDDYVDRTGDGPTPDDYGYYVLFNYQKKSNNYQWRIPYANAQYIEGSKNVNTNHKGTVTYGTKELYYISTIQTKTHIAVFCLSCRQDGAGANGLSNSSPSPSTPALGNSMYKLDKIDLYTINEYTQTNHTPVPIKTINFRYSYSLCPGVPNNTGNSVISPSNPSTNLNINKGKLTLDTLFFTYQNSNRGEASPYIFNYDDKGVTGTNPSYNDTYIDRWGEFKDNSIYSSSAPVSGANSYPYYDFPYTDVYNYTDASGTISTATTQNVYDQAPRPYNSNHFGNYKASLWNLTSINLPTGGTINVDYERKDYAYNENQPATTMFDMVDIGDQELTVNPPTYPATPNPPNLGQSQGIGLDQRNELSCAVNSNPSGGPIIWFKLEQPVPIPSGTPTQQQQQLSSYLLNNYLEGGNLSQVYYKVYCDLLGNASFTAGYCPPANTNASCDYVSGFANIDYTKPYGIALVSNNGVQEQYGYVTLQTVPLSTINYTGAMINPITRACIEYLRAQRPELIYNITQNNNLSPLNQFLSFVGSVATVPSQLLSSFVGFNEYALVTGFGQNVYMNGRSVIRLAEPSGKKYGGGERVHALTLSDNWVNTNNPANPTADYFSYGQTYTYTLDGTPTGTSSGVAYEPEPGFEESALCNPVNYTNSVLFSSNYHTFIETPVMKSYYPGASVGYSKVTVTSIGKSLANNDNTANILSRSAAPMSVYEFYTPKDFPVIFNETDISSDPPITIPIIIPGLLSTFVKRKARSQGYSVILNDMAGKMKRLTVSTQPVSGSTNSNLISEQDYIYQTSKPYNSGSMNTLSDTVQVLTADNTYKSALVGQSSDVFIDMNENDQETYGAGLAIDIDFAAPFELYGAPIPNMSYSDLNVRTIVTNKVIYRTGILQSVVTTTDQSKITKTNLAYDPNTGQPLLTSTTNEFNNDVYNYSYPAYWYYPNMGGAYKNFGMTVSSSASSSPLQVSYNGGIDITGFFLTNQANNYYTNGDLLNLTYASPLSNGSNNAIATVAAINGSVITCIDNSGNYVSSGALSNIQVIRSGYKNLQSLNAGTLVAKKLKYFTPYIPGNGSTLTYNGSYCIDSIVDAKAVEYFDEWKTLCQTYQVHEGEREICMQDGQTINPYTLGMYGIWRPLRSWAYTTGRATSTTPNIRVDGVYSDFHAFPWTNDALASSYNWVPANTITQYSPYGFELENVNAIGVYSAATYGYGNTLVTGVASNSKYHEIGFESFEDYGPGRLSCDDGHFRFLTTTSGLNALSQDVAHTGQYSIKITPSMHNLGFAGVVLNGPDSITQNSNYPSNIDIPPVSNTPWGIGTGPYGPIVANTGPSTTSNPSLNSSTPTQYSTMTFSQADCAGEFWPSINRSYVLSAWVLENPAGGILGVNYLPTYKSPQVQISFKDGSSNIISTSNVTLSASGNIIEGWQRIYGSFTVPANAQSISISLLNTSTTSTVYFDDIRVNPFAGNITTYVYDPILLKPVAELDANNYATIYNYDDEGHLTKIKKETIEGIATIKEGRINNIER